MAKILDGKQFAQEITQGLKRKVARLKKKPGLAVIMLGNNPASKVYVNMKNIRSKEIGYYSELHHLPEGVVSS